MARFARINGDTVRLPELDSIDIGAVYFLDLQLAEVTRDTGHPIRYATLEAASALDPDDPADAAAIAALPPGIEAMSSFVTLWLALRAAGKPATLQEVMALPGSAVELLPEVEDHEEAAGPTKPAASKRRQGSGPRAAAAEAPAEPDDTEA